MPKVVDVECLECGTTDQANWSEFGAEQFCRYCDAAPVYLAMKGAE